MKHWQLRQIVQDTPDSPWREVLSPTDFITAKMVFVIILVALIWFGVGILEHVKILIMGG